ncbi:MAG: hypothetical protein AAFO03_16675 [Bacteroidota bacterium]
MAKKDIFDLFREKASELEQEPTPQAWSRIERRLQANRPSIRRTPVRRLPSPMGIAAGLALLMGLSVVFMWLAEAEQQTPVLAQEQLQFEVEELVLKTAKDDEVAALVEIAQANPLPKPVKPIVEGNANQRLVAKTEHAAQPIEITPSRIDTNTNDQAEERAGR